MTSASELFHSRRCRSALPFDSDSTSSSSRDQHRRHSQHYNYNSNNRRPQHRHHLHGCAPRIHRHLHHVMVLRMDDGETQEHQPIMIEGGSNTPSGSFINSDGLRSKHRPTATATANDRLPGSVLLARDRLVQRLRGVAVSGNRQSSRSSSTTHQNVLEIRINTVAELVSESWQEPRRRNHQSGLNEDELKLEAFSTESCRQNDESWSASMECTICLEGFQDGDKIICLICKHRFHVCCLFPWVRVCGACPNCRKPLLVNVT